jgi:multicomponent K+:H+ antiporter subunit C
MLLLLAIGIGVLTSCGIWLLLRARSFDVILGLALLTYAVNLFIFAMGRVKVNAMPILEGAGPFTLDNTSDPVPQALVLTAIVISFAMSAVLLAIALRARSETGTDHIDGQERQ